MIPVDTELDIPRNDLIAAACLLLPKKLPRNCFGLPVPPEDACHNVISWIEHQRGVAVEDKALWEWRRNSPYFVAFKAAESFYGSEGAGQLNDAARKLYVHHEALEKLRAGGAS